MVCAYQTYFSLNNGCSYTSSSAHLATWGGGKKKAAINTLGFVLISQWQRPPLEGSAHCTLYILFSSVTEKLGK